MPLYFDKASPRILVSNTDSAKCYVNPCPSASSPPFRLSSKKHLHLKVFTVNLKWLICKHSFTNYRTFNYRDLLNFNSIFATAGCSHIFTSISNSICPYRDIIIWKCRPDQVNQIFFFLRFFQNCN